MADVQKLLVLWENFKDGLTCNKDLVKITGLYWSATTGAGFALQDAAVRGATEHFRTSRTSKRPSSIDLSAFKVRGSLRGGHTSMRPLCIKLSAFKVKGFLRRGGRSHLEAT
jgi:hypothetical protein